MSETLSAVLMLIGTTFLLLAAVGVARMPDLFMRMQASTKASTLGIGFLMLAVAINFGELGIALQALTVIAFLFLTAPVAAHMIARAAYFVGVPLCDKTICNELRGHYDMRTHELESVPISSLEHHLPDVEIQLFRIGRISPAAHKTLGQLALRRQLGVTVLAIHRGSRTISNPDADTQLLPEDVLVVIGLPIRLAEAAHLIHSPGGG